MYYRSKTGGTLLHRWTWTYIAAGGSTCVKWRHCCHIESVTSNRKSHPSVDAYLREGHSCQISSRSYLKG